MRLSGEFQGVLIYVVTSESELCLLAYERASGENTYACSTFSREEMSSGGYYFTFANTSIPCGAGLILVPDGFRLSGDFTVLAMLENVAVVADRGHDVVSTMTNRSLSLPAKFISLKAAHHEEPCHI